MAQSIDIITIYVDGMTCAACESKIERKLGGMQGIEQVQASYVKATVKVKYDSKVISLNEIYQAIEKLDYQVQNTISDDFSKAAKKESSNQSAERKSQGAAAQKTDTPKVNINQIIGVVIIIFALYFISSRLGVLNIFRAFPEAEQGMGYGMLFVIGLLTSVHCVAMCGGINLSLCMQYADVSGTKGSRAAAMRPTLLYNTGRVVSYTMVGAIVGAIGSVVSFSGFMKGIVQIAAGIFMVIMGLNMLNIFPWLRRFSLRMPKFFANKVNEQKNSNSPFYVGLMNGLMPCGPLQSMQLYALSTGDPLKGALSMFLFSLGTVPLMFGLGALSSIISKKFTKRMMTVSAVLVIILGVFMFNSGVSVSGFALPDFGAIISAGTGTQTGNGTDIARISNGIQTVTTTLASGRYQPITVQKGVPVKWTIKADPENINGCNNRIIIPKLGKEQRLTPGDNIIEFTPTESGTIPYSCWMGMIRSRITVVDDITNPDTSPSNNSGSLKGIIPSDNVVVAEIRDGLQYVKIDMDSKRFTPAIIVLQSGIAANLTINAVELNSSNSSLLFPLYYAQVAMNAGENKLSLVPDIDFDFSFSDSTVYGYVKVVEDLGNIDIEAIKAEVGNYDPSASDYYSQGGYDSSGDACCH